MINIDTFLKNFKFNSRNMIIHGEEYEKLMIKYILYKYLNEKYKINKYLRKNNITSYSAKNNTKYDINYNTFDINFICFYTSYSLFKKLYKIFGIFLSYFYIKFNKYEYKKLMKNKYHTFIYNMYGLHLRKYYMFAVKLPKYFRKYLIKNIFTNINIYINYKTIMTLLKINDYSYNFIYKNLDNLLLNRNDMRLTKNHSRANVKVTLNSYLALFLKNVSINEKIAYKIYQYANMSNFKNENVVPLIILYTHGLSEQFINKIYDKKIPVDKCFLLNHNVNTELLIKIYNNVLSDGYNEGKGLYKNKLLFDVIYKNNTKNDSVIFNLIKYNEIPEKIIYEIIDKKKSFLNSVTLYQNLSFNFIKKYHNLINIKIIKKNKKIFITKEKAKLLKISPHLNAL